MDFLFSSTDVQPWECQWHHSFQCKSHFDGVILQGVWNLSNCGYNLMCSRDSNLGGSAQGCAHQSAWAQMGIEAFPGDFNVGAAEQQLPGSSWKEQQPCPEGTAAPGSLLTKICLFCPSLVCLCTRASLRFKAMFERETERLDTLSGREEGMR